MGFFTGKKVKKTNPEPPSKVKPLPPPPTNPRNQQQQQQQQLHHGSTQSPTSPSQHWQQPPFQPAGYLPAPPGWTPPAPPSYDQVYRPTQQQQPIVVNQHYYLAHASAEDASRTALVAKLTGSMGNMARDVIPSSTCDVHWGGNYGSGPSTWHAGGIGTQLLNQTAAVADQIASRFDRIMTMIDVDKFSGTEPGLFTCASSHPALPLGGGGGGDSQMHLMPTVQVPPPLPNRPSTSSGGKKVTGERRHPKGQTTAMAVSAVSGSYFDKVEMYSNSRLPRKLPPLKLYVSTWPLLCLAAQYSERVYDAPKGAEKDAHVNADWKTGTKAMVIKSVPMDDMDTIVFAIRGTATFMDWAVNLNVAPTSPAGFLDDPTNFCHSGFLSVARNMIKPVAARLRQLLEEDPGRSSYSLLITGHSAGGAVAALLYSHMLATTAAAQSELNHLTGCFRRVHCVTFGTPPVSLHPLRTPPDRKELRKNVFLAFVNEGDPVTRADKAYVKSLMALLAAPPPVVGAGGGGKASSGAKDAKSSSAGKTKDQARKDKSKTSASSLTSSSRKSSHSSSKSSTVSTGSGGSKSSRKPVWRVPGSSLSNAGRLVVLRSGDPRAARTKGRRTIHERLNEGVVAMTIEDADLRGVVWGDPVCHVMRLYAGRIETLAVSAVMGR